MQVINTLSYLNMIIGVNSDIWTYNFFSKQTGGGSRLSQTLSAIVVYGCQGLLHDLSHDILNRFHFSRDLELMRKQLDFFSTSLYPYNMSFLVLWYSWPQNYCTSLRSRIPPVTLYWFPVASFPVQGILSISAMDLESKYCYFYHSWDFVPYYYPFTI